MSRGVILYLLWQLNAHVAARRRINIARVRYWLSGATGIYLLVTTELSRWRENQNIDRRGLARYILRGIMNE